MVGTRILYAALGWLALAALARADWKLHRSDPSVRWSAVLKAPAPVGQSETGPLPPELPSAEPEHEAAPAEEPEDEETLAEDVIVESPAEPPSIEVLGEVWESSWADRMIEENSFLWRDTNNTAGITPASKGFGLISLSFESVWKTTEVPGVWVVPRFTWTFASGPRAPDVQAQLYDLRLELNFAHEFDETWALHLHLAPAFSSDWNNKSSDAFRLIGGGMLAAHVDEHLTVLGGVVALSRFDIPVLPVGGVRWQPNRRVEIDAVFPNPRFAWCYDEDTEKDETEWLYLGGILGGNQWAVDLASNEHDKLGYSDYRVVIGTETRKKGGEVSICEVGYVFERRLEFSRSALDQTPGGTFMIRWGSRY